MGIAFRIYPEDVDRMGKMLLLEVRQAQARGALLVRQGAVLARSGDDEPIEASLLIRACERLQLGPGAHAVQEFASSLLHFSGIGRDITLLSWYDPQTPFERVQSADAQCIRRLTALLDEVAARAEDAERP